MGTQKFHFHDGKGGSALAVRVTPRASKNEIVEILSDGTVRVRLTAAPTDKESNEALVKFLSEVLQISTSQIEVVAGASGRDKLLSILELGAEAVHERIIRHLGS